MTLAAGASPLFPPQHPDAAAAQAELTEVLQRSPRLYGWPFSRWSLALLRQTVVWLHGLSLSGVWAVLHRFDLHYKRGRRHVHSPDLDYAPKLALIAMLLGLIQEDPRRWVGVYEDELTYYRRPTVGHGYAPAGTAAPLARQGLRSNLYRRIAGCLNVWSGQLFCWQRQHFDRFTLIRYFQALEAHYPDAECIFVFLDNWPVHFHPDLLEALVSTKIILVPLPTYAPWTNPTEKVWRKLYQEVLHLHDYVDRWDELKQTVTDWLAQFAEASPDLLRYVGLHPG